jgi:hypothetical protein
LATSIALDYQGQSRDHGQFLKVPLKRKYRFMQKKALLKIAINRKA